MRRVAGRAIALLFLALSGKETIAHLTRMFAGHDTNHVLQIERIVKRLTSSKGKKKVVGARN